MYGGAINTSGCMGGPAINTLTECIWVATTYNGSRRILGIIFICIVRMGLSGYDVFVDFVEFSAITNRCAIPSHKVPNRARCGDRDQMAPFEWAR